MADATGIAGTATVRHRFSRTWYGFGEAMAGHRWGSRSMDWRATVGIGADW